MGWKRTRSTGAEWLRVMSSRRGVPLVGEGMDVVRDSVAHIFAPEWDADAR